MWRVEAECIEGAINPSSMQPRQSSVASVTSRVWLVRVSPSHRGRGKEACQCPRATPSSRGGDARTVPTVMNAGSRFGFVGRGDKLGGYVRREDAHTRTTQRIRSIYPAFAIFPCRVPPRDFLSSNPCPASHSILGMDDVDVDETLKVLSRTKVGAPYSQDEGKPTLMARCYSDKLRRR